MLNNGKLKLSIFVLVAFVLGMVFFAQASQTNKQIDQLSFKSMLVAEKGEVAGATTITSPIVTIKISSDQTQDLSFVVSGGESVLDLLQKAKESGKITFVAKSYDFGTLIEELNGLKNSDNGKNWMYYLNDQAATVGVESLKVTGGDKVEFKFEKF